MKKRGRPSKGEKVAVTVRLSPSAATQLKNQPNQSDFVNDLILAYFENVDLNEEVKRLRNQRAELLRSIENMLRGC